MNDTSTLSSSTLVVAGKNPKKPGGCVGIFCKLFDWNRRFSKKKFFPKKLLAAARGNKVSKKFNGDGNLLKTKHLLKGELNGCQLKHEMRSPGLVGKLMGLDSMPVVKPQITDKTPLCGNGNSNNIGFVEGSDKEVINLKKSRSRNEFQLQKIQKTGMFERRSVNRFGSDALHIRNVLSRSKKHHPKLASPVKSPRVAKNTSRLIGAATRILEPGLQATSRAKCTLTYSNSMNQPALSSCNNSCLNCGHALEGMNLINDAIEQNRILDMATSSTHNKPMFNAVEEWKQSLDTRGDRESEVVLLRSQYQPEDLSGHHQQETVLHEMQFSPNGQKHCGLRDSSFVPRQMGASPMVGLKHRAQGHTNCQMLTKEDIIPPRSSFGNIHNNRVLSTVAFNDKKDFIAMNQNVSQSQFRLPRKLENCPQDDAGFCSHIECSSSSSKLMAGNRQRFCSNLPYPIGIKSQSYFQGDNVVNGSKDIDFMSFRLNSLKSKPRTYCPTQMDQSKYVNGDISRQRTFKESSHGDKSLGTILEQKLKELISQGENESAAVTPQGRTAAAILQELISALAAERPISPDLNDCSSSDATTSCRIPQVDARGKKLPVGFSSNHFSPGSVLDASFSNDSCVSSSIDDSSGNMLQSDFMDFSIDDPQILHCVTDSSNKETGSHVGVIHLLDHISRVLDKTNLASGNTKEVLFNAELLFGNADHPERFVDFLLGPYLNELETLAISAWRNIIIFSFQVSKPGNISPLRRFLFDCLVECLSVRYDRYSNCGFVQWCRLPRQLDMEALINLFDYEVGKSASLAGMTVDEIIDWEMSTSLGKWSDFDVDMFETSAEISLIIFQGLVDEIIDEFMLTS